MEKKIFKPRKIEDVRRPKIVKKVIIEENPISVISISGTFMFENQVRELEKFKKIILSSFPERKEKKHPKNLLERWVKKNFPEKIEKKKLRIEMRFQNILPQSILFLTSFFNEIETHLDENEILLVWYYREDFDDELEDGKAIAESTTIPMKFVSVPTNATKYSVNPEQ